MLLCERDEPVRELVVIRSAGVLRADGYGVFAARKIEPHAAHIHRDKLIDIARERARALRYSTDIFELRLLHSHPQIRKAREELLSAIRSRLNESDSLHESGSTKS